MKMIAAILILTQLAGPLLVSVPSPPARESSAPVRCCCCPAGACNCGCEAPEAPADSGEEQAPGRSGFCGCDDIPLGLPDAPEFAPQRPVVVWTPPTLQQSSAGPATRVFPRDHWPPGPPPDIPILATIILLD